MLSYIFGGGQAKKDEPKKAIIQHRQHLDMLAKKEKDIEQKISVQEGLARKYVNTNKTSARAALKRKKMLEQELERLQNQIATLESQSNAIESANLNYETLKVMQSGAKAMKSIHGNMNIDKVDATMDEIREQVSLSEEIGDAISRPLGETFDEEDLEEELEAMQQEELDSRMLNAGRVPSAKLPETAHAEVESEEEDEEEELRKLQREMAA
ncbi:Snf7-domain-containing protein [Myxozyma melibiosi]|uniref:Vacuolar-sorting protein SNF7 n=1 Tax=Myxozyma melibiosi TaxID=54550 RepID=A0ABR1F6E3_9ASCO